MNVCVGAFVAAKGAVVDATVTATDVSIVPVPAPHDGEHHHGVFGTVASVNGLTAANSCGGSGAPSTFTLTDGKGTTFTVTVDGSTKFRMPGVTDPTFANVCVGAMAGVEGDVTGTAVTAAGVFVFPTAMDHHDGDHEHKGFGSFPSGAAFPGSPHVDSHDGAEHHSTAGAGTSGGSGVSGSKVVSSHRARHGH